MALLEIPFQHWLMGFTDPGPNSPIPMEASPRTLNYSPSIQNWAAHFHPQDEWKLVIVQELCKSSSKWTLGLNKGLNFLQIIFGVSTSDVELLSSNYGNGQRHKSNFRLDNVSLLHICSHFFCFFLTLKHHCPLGEQNGFQAGSYDLNYWWDFFKLSHKIEKLISFVRI